MNKTVKNCLLMLRVLVENFLDFCFSLYWEFKKKPIPDVEKEHSFLADSATSLAKRIRNKELKSVDLVQAVIDRIKQVNPILNAVVGERYDEALEEARNIDSRISSGLSDEEFAKKPFLGVPFTTKECQAIKGMSLTFGVWSRRHEVATEDCEAIVQMRAAGAIPLATTNLPEMLLWIETRNLIFGTTYNPHHTGRTPGGSSGGEAALMASYGIPISLGSDIGGSIRMPAFYCGLFGHLPTADTTNLKGSFLRNGDEGPTMACLGFISKHAEDLGPLTKIIVGDNASLMNLDRDVNIKDIQFYYIEQSSDCHVSKIKRDLRNALKRVITTISEEVTSADNSPKPYYHKGLDHMYLLWDYMMTKEPEDIEMLYHNNGNKANAVLELIKKILGLSQHCLSSIYWLIKLRFIPKVDPVWAENILQDLKKDLFNKLGDNGVLIMPSGTDIAPYNYASFFKMYNFGYWGIVNAMKCPSTEVPIGVNHQGLPIGIQVVSSPYNDAVSLAVAKYLEKRFGGSVMPCKVK